MSIFKNVLKKAGGAAMGLIKNAVKSTPIGNAVMNTVSQVKSMSTATGTKKTTVSSAVTSSPTKSSPSNKTGGGKMKAMKEKIMEWFSSLKSKNPFLYYLAWVVVIGITGLVIYLLIRFVMWLVRKIFRKKNRTTRTVRGYRPKPISKAPTTYMKKAGKRKPSPAQLAALKKGRDALKRKRKR